MIIVRRLSIAAVAAVATVLASTAFVSSGEHCLQPSDDANVRPVVDVHHLMEDIVESAFDTVQSGLGERPADAKAWKRVRGASVTIAETGNLLLGRRPEDAEAKEWAALAGSLRDRGEELYKAARAKDYDAAKRAYATVVTACNSCHTKFAEGEPKIEP